MNLFFLLCFLTLQVSKLRPRFEWDCICHSRRSSGTCPHLQDDFWHVPQPVTKQETRGRQGNFHPIRKHRCESAEPHRGACSSRKHPPSLLPQSQAWMWGPQCEPGKPAAWGRQPEIPALNPGAVPEGEEGEAEWVSESPHKYCPRHGASCSACPKGPEMPRQQACQSLSLQCQLLTIPFLVTQVVAGEGIFAFTFQRLKKKKSKAWKSDGLVLTHEPGCENGLNPTC